MAVELKKRLDPAVYPKYGFVLQLLAAGWHFKSEAQIARLAALVGPARIQVIHGTGDNMVSFPHGQELAEALGDGVKVRFIEGQGHVIPIEMRAEFKEWMEELIEKTAKMGSVKANGHAKRNGKLNDSNGHTNGHANGKSNGHSR